MDLAAIAALVAIMVGLVTLGGLAFKCLLNLAWLLGDLRGRPGSPSMMERQASLEKSVESIKRALGIEDE